MRRRTRIRNLLPDKVVDLYAAMRTHKACHGRYPNLIRPRTFNEWIARRKALDRRALLTRFSDKYAVRDYVAELVGPGILSQLYWVTREPADIPFDQLPERFVVKPTHGSGWINVVRDKRQLDVEELVQQCRSWLAMDYYRLRREWPYKDVVPRILIEEYIDDGSRDSPNDYKFYVFGGRVELIQVDVARFSKHERSLFDRNWQDANMRLTWPPIAAGVREPRHLADMIRVAEVLGKDLDFIRVDLYDTGQRIYFGEITTTPGAGCGRFEPASADEHLGDLWARGARVAKSSTAR
jgi:hypothetical protein